MSDYNARPSCSKDDNACSSDVSEITISTSKSVVWNFFSKLNSSAAAKCNYCSMTVKTPTGSTTNLVRHINKHPSVFSQFKLAQVKQEKLKNENKKMSQPTQPKLRKLDHYLDKGTQPWPSDSPRAKKITNNIAEWIAKSLHPYSLVEEEGFLNLMKETVPLYRIPTRTTFSRHIIPNLYSETKSKILENIRGSKKYLQSISYTTDIWTADPGHSYISFTIHFIDENIEMKRYALATIYFPGEHTGIKIRENIKHVCKDWELSVENNEIPQYIITDNARNMNVAFDEDFWQMVHVKCFAHTLQLCINDAKTENKGLQNMLSKCRSIVGHYKHSQKATSKLQEFQNLLKLPNHSLFQDVDTRWNSEFIMLERLVEQKAAVTAELALSESTIQNLTNEEWSLAEGYLHVLQPFHHATNAVCEDLYPTLSLVLPILHGIEKCLFKIITNKEKGTTLARSLSKCILTRFPLYRQNKLYVLSMIMDPRFKHIVLKTHEKDNAKLWLEQELVASNTIQTFQEQIDPPNTQLSSSKSCSLFEDIDMNMQTDSVTSEDESQQEINLYWKTSCIIRKENPLLWWKTNKTQYKTLVQLARKYLGIPATSVASERLFSVAGNVITDKRHRLTPEHLDQLVFLHENLK